MGKEQLNDSAKGLHIVLWITCNFPVNLQRKVTLLKGKQNSFRYSPGPCCTSTAVIAGEVLKSLISILTLESVEYLGPLYFSAI